MELELEYIQNLRKKGYTEDFTSNSTYSFLFNSSRMYKPHEFKIAAYYKYPGSEAGENCILFAIETNDGKKGILLDNCGEEAEEKISRFIHAVTEARLFSKRHWFFCSVQNLFRFRFSSNL